MALAGFALALGAEWVLRSEHTERDWWAARAVAESTKTLAWRYAVSADPFPKTLSSEDADHLLAERTRQVLDSLNIEIEVPLHDELVSEAMRKLRSKPFTIRRATYVAERLEAQWDWYDSKAKLNRKRAKQWRLTLLAAELLGVILAVPRVFTMWSLDVAGILAAVVASAAAWVALKQYQNLSSAYSAAANDLALAVQKIRNADEVTWDIIVSDAEEAISREHTLWLASRLGRRSGSP